MTKIEWTDKSWNPVTGCTKISAGCQNCYAERMARRLAGRYGYPEVPNHFDVIEHGDKAEAPLGWRGRLRIFVCSMGDLFHEGVEESLLVHLFDVMHQAHRHAFQILTKRPERMREYVVRYNQEMQNASPPRTFAKTWPNIWLGVSVEDQEAADERMPILLDTPAAVRFVSVEPLLERVGIDRWLGTVMDCPVCGPVSSRYWTTMKTCGLCMDLRGTSATTATTLIRNPRAGLDWIIVGCESGPKRRHCDIDWIRDVRDQCVATDTPFFLKQMEVDGKLARMLELDGRVWNQMPGEKR